MFQRPTSDSLRQTDVTTDETLAVGEWFRRAPLRYPQQVRCIGEATGIEYD